MMSVRSEATRPASARFVGIVPDYTRDLSHLVLGRWRELVPLNLREIGRADPDHLRGGNQSCRRNKRTAA